MVQMVTWIGTLLFLAFVVALLFAAGWLCRCAIARTPVRAPLAFAAATIAGYAGLIFAGSAASRDRRVALGTPLCFDDWCTTVTAVRERRSEQTRSVVVEMRIASVAQRVMQRASNPQVYVIDDRGAWHLAQLLPDARDLRSPLAPGESFVTSVAANVPAQAGIAAVRVWEGAWVDAIVPFDEQSPFHGKTFYSV